MPKVRERLDLLWFKRKGLARSWLGRLCLLGVLLAAGLSVFWTLRGDRRVYWARPVSSAHQMFAEDCAACHRQQGTPLLRLLSVDDRLPSVTDADCRRCHAQTTRDHHSRQSTVVVRSCVDCHREHGGHAKLVNLSDANCTQCHAKLQTTDGQHRFTPEVMSFEEHPQFKVWRGDDAAVAAKMRSDHAVDPGSHQLLQIAAALEASEAAPARWTDKTPLRFNHRLHLAEQGVLVPPSESSDALRRVLNCYDCHQPDSSGAYMVPINYEQHCATCHKLEFSGKIALPGRPLPHQNVEIVEGMLRERLLNFAERHPEELTEPLGESPSRLPQRSDKPEPSTQAKWDFVETELGAARQEVFQNAKQGCRLCHQLAKRVDATSAKQSEWEVVPPRIPDRWFPHSRFDHRRHREISCERCHDPQFEQREDRGHKDERGQYSALNSAQTSDLLLPRVETCQQCHGSKTESSIHASGAKSDCVLCHHYHGTDRADEPKGRMDAWLNRQPDR